MTEEWAVQWPDREKVIQFSTEAKARTYINAATGKDFVRIDGSTVRAWGLKLLRRTISDWEEVDLGT